MVAVEPSAAQARLALNLDACIGCRSCAVACFYGHQRLPILRFARTGAVMLPAVCRQCAEAPCVLACPSEAMIHDQDGTNYRATLRCTGCGSCAPACPFGVLSDEVFDGEIAKCDLCRDRLADGLGPRCVASCPTGALQFVQETEAAGLGLVVLGSRTLGQHPIRRR